MNKLHILILVTAAISVAAWFAHHRADQRFGLEDGELLLPQLADQLGKIDEIIVDAAGQGSTRLRNVDGQWQVAERDGYPAEIDKLSTALRDLSLAKKLEAKTALASHYARLGVQDVDLAEDTTLRLQALAGGDSVVDLIVGKSGRGGNYVRLSGDEQSWLIDQRLVLPRKPADYLDKALLKLPRDEVLKLSVTPLQGPSYSIVQADQPGQFALQPPAAKDKQLNVANVNRLAAALANLRISDVLSSAPEDLQWSQAELTGAQGLKLQLELAKGDNAGQRYLKLLASVDPDYAQRLSDEAAKAAEAADQAASDGETDAPEPPSVEAQVAAAQARAESLNARTRDRIFVAPQYTVDALMMSHEMLQKDPPDSTGN